MGSKDTTPVCEHCGAQMSKWMPPADSGWEDIQYVCFNDECGYYVRGWDWMLEKYQLKVSYRNRIDPKVGKGAALPVWSEDALKDRIIE